MKTKQNKLLLSLVMCAVAIGLGVVSCKKEQAVQTPTVILDEKIPSDDEAIAKELFAMHNGLTKNNKANDKIKDEVDNSPKEINKAIFLIEAYLNYKYDDSTSFELTSIDTSYITIPASLANNNKYQVEYTKFIEAYDKSEIETISHQQREKLRLTNPTVVVIDIELVTPEDPKIQQKEFVTRVITVMGYNQQMPPGSNPPAVTCEFNISDYWYYSAGNAIGTTNYSGGCGTFTGQLSNAEKEIVKKLNYCNASCNRKGYYYTNVESKRIFGGPSSQFPLIYWKPAPFGVTQIDCFNPTKMTEQRDAIRYYSNNMRPPAKSIVAYNYSGFAAYVNNANNIQTIDGYTHYGKCVARPLNLNSLN